MRIVLLISNQVMHYRVSVYNYFFRRFREIGWDFVVRADKLQKNNPHSIEFNFKQIAFSFREYKREIKTLRPQVVILFLQLKNLVIWPLIHWLHFRKIRVIFWTKGINLDNTSNPISMLLYRYLHSISDGLLLYSSHETKYVSVKNRKKIIVANNAINFNDFPIIPESKEMLREEFGIPFRKIVLFCGRMGINGERKKVNHLIEVFREISVPGAGCLIVGSGLSQEHASRMNPATTRYLGEIYDPHHLSISKIFKLSDIFSIPGHVGLGLNQAFFWGLPVVTEEGGQPPEIQYLINGRNGFIVPEGDIGALKEKIELLLIDANLRETMSYNARNDILITASVSGMFDAFRSSVEHGSRSDISPGEPYGAKITA